MHSSEKVGIPLIWSVLFINEMIFPVSNSTCSHNDAWHRLFAGDGSRRVGILRHLQMKMQRAKWLSTKRIPRAQVETICIRQISSKAIIISFASQLCFPLREKCEHSQMPFIQQRYFVPFTFSAWEKKGENGWEDTKGICIVSFYSKQGM